MMSGARTLQVLLSGAFRPAYQALTANFEERMQCRLVMTAGGSMGASPTAIPNRLRRGERYDVVILAYESLSGLVSAGFVVPDSMVPLARSGIGVAVRAGDARPEISTAAAFSQTVLAAARIGYSSSASGVYLESLFQRLGLLERLRPQLRQVVGEPVGAVLARGDLDLGLQQISELLPIPGIDYIGPLPEELQQVTIFSGAVTVAAADADLAQALLQYLADPTHAQVLQDCGLQVI